MNWFKLLKTAFVPSAEQCFFSQRLGGYLMGWGPAIPTGGTAGWAPRALYIAWNDSGIGLYVNAGTAASCNFTAVGTMTGFGTVTPTAGNIWVGNAGATAFASVAVSGDATLASTGALTLADKLTNAIADPGAAGAIAVTKSGYCDVVTAAAETRTLAAPTFRGQRLSLAAKTLVGNCVITCSTTVNAAGNNTVTFTAAGQALLLIAKTNGANLRWSVVGTDGATISTV